MMRRTLSVGAAATVLLVVALAPAGAVGPTRSSRFAWSPWS